MIKWLPRLAWLLILLVAVMACGRTQLVGQTPPQAKEGVLDVRDWDFARQGSISLEGEWAFYWQDLLWPQQLEGQAGSADYVTVPNNWHEYELAGETLSREGYATYRLILYPPKQKQVYGLYLEGQGSAYSLWIDGQLLAQDGQVGKSRQEVIPDKKQRVVFFQPNRETVELVMQISNFHHRNGGFRNEIRLDFAEPAHQFQLQQWFVETLLFGVLLIMGLYHIFLFIYRPRDKSALYFALMSLLTAVRSGLTSQNLLHALLPSFSWAFMLRVEYLTFYFALPLFSLFLKSLYPEDMAKWFIRVIFGIAIAFSFFMLATPTFTASFTVDYYQIIILIELLYIFLVLSRTLVKGREDALLITLACFALSATIVIDILYLRDLIPFGDISSYGFLIFIFVQAILLSLRFSKTFHLVETLEEKYRRLFEDSKDIIFITDLEGRMVDINPVCEALLGYSRQEALQMSAQDVFVDPKDAARFRAAMKKGWVKDLEFKFRRKDGREIDVLVTSTLRQDAAGAVLGVQGIARDISKQKQVEAERLHALELQKAKEAAEAANQAKSTFLANMSHELRTPLNAILGFSQIISDSDNIPAEHQDNLGIIITSGEHLLTLVNQVLDLSKIEAGKITLDEKDMDFYRLLNELEGMFRLKAEYKGLRLIFDRMPTLPHYIRTDTVKLRQVLINLLNNALKFTEKGSVTLRVTTNPEQINPCYKPEQIIPAPAVCLLHFEVIDTGPGIAPAELDTLFEAFIQTETGRQSQEGTGLGLTISQGFVRLMGGQITVSSRIGQGTTFTFDIEVEPVSQVREAVEETDKDLGRQAGYEQLRHLPDVSNDEKATLALDALTMLPAASRTRLADAVDLGDLETIEKALKEIEVQHADLATVLRQLAHDFEYDAILKLLEPAGAKD